MNLSISKIINQTIWFSYLALVIITPLLFSTKNSELFEVPKMLFVYFAAAIIFFATFIKFVLEGKTTLPKSDNSWINMTVLAFIFFVAIQVVSTFVSIDKFTSIFGYPTRLNGGLLSQFAYLIIFICALVNLNVKQVKTLIIAAVLGAFAVSLWGIPAHFGKDPNCLVLEGKLTSDCWQKEFNPRLRIFSTLGQPNWLASYLVLTIPLSISLLLISKTPGQKFIFALISLTLILAIIFTNSRAGTLGLILALAIFFALLGGRFLRKNFKITLVVIIAFIALGAIFGSTLYSRFSESLRQYLPTISDQRLAISPPGTESGAIRLVVWQGAWEAFKEKPMFGFGPETFAYSYYLFRPTAHNNTTEWNFLYNKAHNEFLNYAANVGLSGLLGYTALIGISLVAAYRTSKRQNRENSVVAKSIIAAILGYQATIFFGFSVVTTQILMFLLIALATIQKPQLASISLSILKRPNYKTVSVILIAVLGLWSLSLILRVFLADIFFVRAQSLDLGKRSLRAYANALDTFPVSNPFYLSDYAYTTALYTASIEDSQTQTLLIDQTVKLSQKAQSLGPDNQIVIKRLANSYFLIATVETQYQSQALELAGKLPGLSPTDPQSYLSLGKIQAGLDYTEEAKQSLEKALELKPDYLEAQELLDQIEAKELQ